MKVDAQERFLWVLIAIALAMMSLGAGSAFGGCKERKAAVQSGCAEWTSDPETGAATIDWCVCPEGE